MRLTVRKALDRTAKRLGLVAKSNAPIDAELILGAVLNTTRERILGHDADVLSPAHAKAFMRIVSQRAKGRPLAYCLGYQYFNGLKFLVKPGVLIPRPDSELLFDLVFSKFPDNKLTIADIGTGSGCLGIALAHNRPNWKILAVDKSKTALAVARKNAKLNKISTRVKFKLGDLLRPLSSNRIDLIVANLPYLTPDEIRNEPTIKYEPKLALDAGLNGLRPYERLFKQYRIQKRTCPLLLEIDPRRKTALARLVHKLLPSHKMTWHRDLGGKWRALELYVKEKTKTYS